MQCILVMYCGFSVIILLVDYFQLLTANKHYFRQFHDRLFKCTVCVAHAPMLDVFQGWRKQPNYSVLVDTRDRLSPQITYVPQENIDIIVNMQVTHSTTFHLISYIPHLPSFVSICAGQVIYSAAETKYWSSTTHIDNSCLSCDQLLPQCPWLFILSMQHYLYKAALWNI